MNPFSDEDNSINSTCPSIEANYNPMHEIMGILSDEYLSGFINIPFAWDWTLIVYLLIVFFKVHVAYNGASIRNLPKPLKYISEKIYSVFRWPFQFLSEVIFKDWIDDHSLFSGANSLKTQIAVSFFTFVVVIVPFGETVLNVHFLAVLTWHLLYLYRDNLFRLIGFTFALWVVWIEHGFIGEGVDCAGIVYMMFILGLCAWQLLPNEVNLDLLLIYIAWLAYLVFQFASSLSEHGLLPRKTLEELLEQSRFARILADIINNCSSVDNCLLYSFGGIIRNLNIYLLPLTLRVKLEIKGIMLMNTPADGPKFQWMPMPLSESMSFDTPIY